MRGRFSILFLASVAALMLGAVAAAGTSHPSKTTRTAQRLYNTSDQALARSIVLKGQDLGPRSTWSGGLSTPDTSTPRTCANFHATQSDVVITGDSQSDYAMANGVSYHDEAQVMQTSRMVKLDWQRNVANAAALTCLKTFLAKSLPSGEHLVSLTRLPVPHIAAYTIGYRALIDQQSAGQQTVRTMLDVMFVGRNRTELTLETSAPYATHVATMQSELHLAHLLVSRTPAHG
jgi:hypothetical protein